MNENFPIQLSETVILIDAAFLNKETTGMKRFFEKMLKRTLPIMDLSDWSLYLLQDSAFKGSQPEIQFIVVYDEDSRLLQNFVPSDLKDELDGKGFRYISEYYFTCVPTEGLASREDVFIELLSIVSESEKVKNIAVIPFYEEYGEAVDEILKDATDKDIIQFSIEELSQKATHRWDNLGFSIMRAYGVSPQEL